jgi:hypothetical protein
LFAQNINESNGNAYSMSISTHFLSMLMPSNSSFSLLHSTHCRNLTSALLFDVKEYLKCQRSAFYSTPRFVKSGKLRMVLMVSISSEFGVKSLAPLSSMSLVKM